MQRLRLECLSERVSPAIARPRPRPSMAGVGSSVPALMQAADALLRAYFRQMGSMERQRWRRLLAEADKAPEPPTQGHMQPDIDAVLRQRARAAKSSASNDQLEHCRPR